MTHSFPTRRSSGLGEVGEVVVTTLNADYPLLRFATGDLSATMPGTSPCGRTAPRIRGWMGRADQTTKVKGMFVHRAQVAAVLKRNGEIRRAVMVVHRQGARDMIRRASCRARVCTYVSVSVVAVSLKLKIQEQLNTANLYKVCFNKQ